jgi:hypothetical protein
MGHLPSILFTLHSSGAIAVGGDREEGDQLLQFAHKRRERLRRERERESLAGGAYAVLKYVLLYNTTNPNTLE